jgi:hypothetical protein
MTTSMPAPRTAYDDLAEPAQLREDCQHAGRALDLRVPVRDAVRTAPALRFEDQPADEQGMLAAAHMLAQALLLEDA